MKFVILGASNLLASRVIQAFREEGRGVVYYGPWKPRFVLPEGVEHVPGEIDDLPFRKEDLGKGELEGVVVLNAFGEETASCVLETFWNRTRSYVVASSANVYRAHGRLRRSEPGEAEGQPIGESAPLRGRALPGEEEADLRGMEKRFRESGQQVTLLRLPPLYGPGDWRFRFLPLMRRMLDERMEIPLGELQASWRWTHGYVDDVANAFLLAGTKPSQRERVYNVGEQNPPSVKDRIEQIATILNWEGRVVVRPDEDLADYLRLPIDFAQDLIYDTRRIRKELRYKERGDYYENLRASVEWYAEHRPREVVGVDYSYALEDMFLEAGSVGQE